MNVTDIFSHQLFDEDEVFSGGYSTTVYQKDVALLKLATSLDIDVYKTVSLPDTNTDYRTKHATYYGESTFSY